MRKALVTLFCMISLSAIAVQTNPPVVSAFLDRIGGKGANALFITELNDSQADDAFAGDAERFTIGQRDGKPCIVGTSLSAITTGVNWYLNHYAHVNLSWNNLTTNLKKVELPLPEKEESHCSNACNRYYLNYCTFSYSMSVWTWERWQQEIDWMALHGINMPLQIVGLEVVWRDMLMIDYGYSREEANAFVAGPAYQAWWGMNNLEGTGGPNPDWWYERQRQLAAKILARERELGMQPVLPGFSGMVPSDFNQKTGAVCESQGGWCSYQRPFIMDPTSLSFAAIAERYYHRLQDVMGTSKYYSMDPFHEGGSISSGLYAEGYKSIFEAMDKYCGHDTEWVIQQWQWSVHQAKALTSVPRGRLVVLDLFSDGNSAFDYYHGYEPQKAVYCTIPNFGGRTGLFGRLPKMADDYFSYKSQYPSIIGIGAAPEAIEQVPVSYDLLYELAWMNEKPDVKKWINEYVSSRYGRYDRNIKLAWDLLLESALDNTTSMQGPHEATICSRPSLTVDRVSTWGSSELFYDKSKLYMAARQMLLAEDVKHTNVNYIYDLVDITRQALTDYSASLLCEVKEAHEAGNDELFCLKRDKYLELIIDIDKLLGTCSQFRLGNWTEKARAIADEVDGATINDKEWLELDNARTLITTWGNKSASDAGLNDYSYREWQGLLSDFYYMRWKYWFDHDMQSPDSWYPMEYEWIHNTNLQYSSKPIGNPYKTARKLIRKYLTTCFR